MSQIFTDKTVTITNEKKKKKKNTKNIITVICVLKTNETLVQNMLSTVNDGVFTCIVPETTPVQKSPVLVVVILRGHFVLLLEAGKREECKNVQV